MRCRTLVTYNLNSLSFRILKINHFLRQSTVAKCCDNQSIPRITSKSITSNRTKSAHNSLPSINTGQFGRKTSESKESLRGVATDKEISILEACQPDFEANTGDTKEWVAPGSNKTLASRKQTEIVPATMALDACASY